jgi:hypothetical protein
MTGIEILKIGGVIGFLMPPLIALIVKSHWTAQRKGVVAFLVCVAAALVTILYEDRSIDWHDWRNASLMVFSAALFFYHLFWKPSNIAPTIEQKTT